MLGKKNKEKEIWVGQERPHCDLRRYLSKGLKEVKEQTMRISGGTAVQVKGPAKAQKWDGAWNGGGTARRPVWPSGEGVGQKFRERKEESDKTL